MAASYISVPRDLTKVKSKVMFNLTKRQLICFGMAVLIGVPSFFLMKTVMKTNTAVIGSCNLWQRCKGTLKRIAVPE